MVRRGVLETVTTYTWFPQPAEMASFRRRRRHHYAMDRYRAEQQRRIAVQEPLLPALDDMTEARRTELGLYDGHDPDECPEGCFPPIWAGLLRELARYESHVPGQAERDRGYDIYGKAVQ